MRSRSSDTRSTRNGTLAVRPFGDIPFDLPLLVMSWPQTPMPAATTDPGAEPYLPVEEVARKGWGSPGLGILLRRVEAGDVPSRREEGPDGVRFLVRLGDLGIESPVDEHARDRHPRLPLRRLNTRRSTTVRSVESVDRHGPAACGLPVPCASRRRDSLRHAASLNLSPVAPAQPSVHRRKAPVDSSPHHNRLRPQAAHDVVAGQGRSPAA